jgi:hypothetical protein
MQTHTKLPLLTDTNRRVAFLIPITRISNKIWFRHKALILWSIGWLLLTLYERILTTLQIVAS